MALSALEKKFIKEDKKRVLYWMDVYEAAPTPEKGEQLKQVLDVFMTTVEIARNKSAKRVVESFKK